MGTGSGSPSAAGELAAGGTDRTATLDGGLGSERDPAHAPSAKLARIGIMDAIGKLDRARIRWGCVTIVTTAYTEGSAVRTHDGLLPWTIRLVPTRSMRMISLV